MPPFELLKPSRVQVGRAAGRAACAVARRSLARAQALKSRLLNTVSAALIKEPVRDARVMRHDADARVQRFSGKESISSRICGASAPLAACRRRRLTTRAADLVMRIANYDPEFVLKIAGASVGCCVGRLLRRSQRRVVTPCRDAVS